MGNDAPVETAVFEMSQDERVFDTPLGEKPAENPTLTEIPFEPTVQATLESRYFEDDEGLQGI